MRFTEAQQRQLLTVAATAIRHGLDHGRPPEPPVTHDEMLRDPGASFVTLKISDRLRGCIGSLEPYRPLIEDVAQNAWSAAFRDPRFLPLRADEYPDLQLSISVLSPAEALSFDSQEQLLRQLRPGIDGLILESDGHRGTFLPAVWESLPDAQQFLTELKHKAGLAPDYWSDDIRVSRYTTDSFSAE